MTDICFLTTRELRAALGARDLSAREVVEAHLRQIERVNADVNAVVTLVGEQALAEAAAADERAARGAELPALHGIPVAHKDTHDTAGIRTTYGSPLHAHHVPERDELVIERMRAAGVITLGKTNVPEFAAGSHTFNPVFGATRNPYDPARSAGGSSGGAAAALASGMHPLADGSDLGGSLRNPASFCNVVGFRPSPGRVPSWPAPLGWTGLSTAGPMARTVADAALLLSVLAGPDPRSPIALDEPGETFARPLDTDVRGLRVAWSPDLGGAVPVEPEVAAVVEASADVLADLGCAVERACPDFTGADEAFRILRAWQFAVKFGPMLDTAGDRLKDSIRWNTEEGLRLSGTDLGRAEVLRTELFHRFREFFGRYDFLMLPVSQVPPFDSALEYPTTVAGTAMETYLDWMRSAYYVTVSGSPALSVPAGFTPDGLPVGVQIVGPHRADFAVLQLGHAFEQATQTARRRPALA
ncbi:amidase [Amycolatopsis endophytica]|uniref:Amidase n=1 Tax=Amycolatopsis endophytica TaxID=860233 RepID=A0A853BDT7_9PSEU|nr:amidase [Amycolatopsis endophytica]NYI92821.1 amidase [Amycolatopsis endophytica]